MENENIVLVKLYSGDMILGKKICTSTDSVVELVDPRMIAIAPTMTGSVRVALGSVCEPFNVKRLKESFSVQKSQVMFELSEDEIDKELLNGYKSEISGIKIATAAETASLNGSPKPGEFIL